jgi:hypothetical protein
MLFLGQETRRDVTNLDPSLPCIWQWSSPHCATAHFYILIDDTLQQISIYHCLVFDNGLLLIVLPPIFTSSLMTLSNSSTCSPWPNTLSVVVSAASISMEVDV